MEILFNSPWMGLLNRIDMIPEVEFGVDVLLALFASLAFSRELLSLSGKPEMDRPCRTLAQAELRQTAFDLKV